MQAKIDRLNELYNYIVKISVIISLIFTILFFFVKDYGFALFSVTGVNLTENEYIEYIRVYCQMSEIEMNPESQNFKNTPFS